ncbi:uncharacterized protein G2W53_010650 [Senna tora]|uniref:Uncharacterized protein n=1 Tax=Senna tora TaxID=362788 RepID=A0A834X093_9FABA|nr:uncharacterized protein G2W53_010650 [Senna tora]
MAYVQSPCTARDFILTKLVLQDRSQATGWFSLAHQQQQGFPAHLKRVGFHSLTNNDKVFPLT